MSFAPIGFGFNAFPFNTTSTSVPTTTTGGGNSVSLTRFFSYLRFFDNFDNGGTDQSELASMASSILSNPGAPPEATDVARLAATLLFGGQNGQGFFGDLDVDHNGKLEVNEITALAAADDNTTKLGREDFIARFGSDRVSNGNPINLDQLNTVARDAHAEVLSPYFAYNQLYPGSTLYGGFGYGNLGGYSGYPSGYPYANGSYGTGYPSIGYGLGNLWNNLWGSLGWGGNGTSNVPWWGQSGTGSGNAAGGNPGNSLYQWFQQGVSLFNQIYGGWGQGGGGYYWPQNTISAPTTAGFFQ